MKKILFVMNTMGRAGAERALIALMKTLPVEKYKLSLLVLTNRGEIFDEVPGHVTLLNKRPDHRSVLSAGGRIALMGTALRCFFYRFRGFRLTGYLIRNLLSQMRKHRISPDKLLWRVISDGTKSPDETYDLAVAYLEGGSTYFVADHVRAKKKASFIHIDYVNAGYTRELDLDAYDKIDRIFSVSREAGESFAGLYPEYREKLFLFRNIIDTSWIREQSLKELPGSDAFAASEARYKLLTIGRLAYQKAYDIAIPALRLLREAGIDVDWFVLGEGPLEGELREQIAREQLTKHFVLLGSKQNPYPYLRLATLYVHATRFEGKSIAIEEAQVLGKAIIASDCTGNREQITPGLSGELISLSPESIADSVGRLLSCPDKLQKYEKASLSAYTAHSEDLDAFLELL